MGNIWAQEQINRLRAQYPEGTRIQVDSMENDPRPISSGTKGTVLYVDDIGRFIVNLTTAEVLD